MNRRTAPLILLDNSVHGYEDHIDLLKAGPGAVLNIHRPDLVRVIWPPNYGRTTTRVVSRRDVHHAKKQHRQLMKKRRRLSVFEIFYRNQRPQGKDPQ